MKLKQTFATYMAVSGFQVTSLSATAIDYFGSLAEGETKVYDILRGEGCTFNHAGFS